VPPLQHRRQQQLGQQGERGDVDLYQARFFIGRRLGEQSVRAESRVVDQDVDRQPPGRQVADDGLGSRGHRQILREHVGLDAMRADEIDGDRRQLVGAPRHQDQVDARSGEDVGQLFADAAGRAGDQGRLGHVALMLA
jgi:hypothetical protein